MSKFIPLAKMTSASLAVAFPKEWEKCKKAFPYLPVSELENELRSDLFYAGVTGVRGNVPEYLPSLPVALLTFFGGGSIKKIARPGRGGYTLLRLAQAAPDTLENVTARINRAIRHAGFKPQNAAQFPTRRLSGDGSVEFYVERTYPGDPCPNQLLISLEGTAQKPVICIE